MLLREKKYDLNAIIHGIITLAVLAILYLLVKRLSGVLLPFVLSWAIAYMLVPIVRFFQYKCKLKNRPLSVGVTLVVVIAALVGLLALLVPMIGNQIGLLSEYVQRYMAKLSTDGWLTGEWAEQYKELVAMLDVQSLMKNPEVTNLLQKLAPTLWSWLATGVNAITGFFVVFVCLLYVIFILIDYEKLTDSWPLLIPIPYRERVKMMASDLDRNMNAYFRGQAMVAGCVGALFAIGFAIIGLPMGVAIGLFIGLLNLVPYLQMVGIPVCILLGIVQSAETGRPLWIVMLCILVVFVVVQTLQDMVLVPKIQGKAMGMNPAMILLSLSIWGALLGFIGLIIALPVTTLMVSYYKRFVLHDENGNGIPDELE